MSDIVYCWLKWEIKVIKADHDGYCTDSENIDEIYYLQRYYQYELNNEEYYTLIWLNNECPKIFQNEVFVKAAKPSSTKKRIKHNGSDYCNSSVINGLNHEIHNKPIKIIDFNIDNIKTNRKKFIVDSLSLKQFLLPIIEKNNVINTYLEAILPMEIIDIILKIMLNEHFNLYKSF